MTIQIFSKLKIFPKISFRLQMLKNRMPGPDPPLPYNTVYI